MSLSQRREYHCLNCDSWVSANYAMRVGYDYHCDDCGSTLMYVPLDTQIMKLRDIVQQLERRIEALEEKE